MDHFKKVMQQNSLDDQCVEVRQLRFVRGSRMIFDQIDFQVQRGKITAIMGPSGSGKTTLLQLMGGQLKPDSGSIWIEGQNLANVSRQELYKIRKKIGVLFQSGALFSDLSVFENVAFPLREHSQLPESMIRDLVLMKLEAVGLRGTHTRMPAELSGGMARRVALARTIALDPALIMFDEPFAGQDPISMGVLVQLIRLLNKALQMTTIIVSHDVQETMSIADYIYLIANGRVVSAGTPEALRDSSDPWVQQFIKGLPDGPVPFHYPASSYAEDLLGRSGAAQA